MSKRFEATGTNSLNDLIRAYEILGIAGLIGDEGENTAFQTAGEEDGCVCFHTLPGRYSAGEIKTLLRDAFGGVRPAEPAALPQAA